MTTYSGETILLSHVATFDGVALDDTNTNSVVITIYDGDDAVVETSAMTWSADDDRWEYWWDTDGVDPANYQVKVVITTDNGVNWEYFKVSIKTNKVPLS